VGISLLHARRLAPLGHGAGQCLCPASGISPLRRGSPQAGFPEPSQESCWFLGFPCNAYAGAAFTEGHRVGADLVGFSAKGQPGLRLREGSSSVLNWAVGLGGFPKPPLSAEGLMALAQRGAAFRRLRAMGMGWLARLAQLTPSLPVPRPPQRCHVGAGGQSRLHHRGSDGPDPHAAMEWEW